MTTPEYFLAPHGSALKWKAALLVPRLADLPDAVCAAHTRTGDLILATARSWQLTKAQMASRWQTFQDAQWEDFATVTTRRRKHEVRTILHAKDRRDPEFQDAAKAMALHDFIASLGQNETNASTLGVCSR